MPGAGPHLNFASDNAGPAHPAIMEAILAANAGHAMSYGADTWTAGAIAAIREVFEAPEAEVRLVPSGIAANALSLSCLVRPWQRVFCSQIAHIECDENGAVTLASGADLALVPHSHGLMAAEALATRVDAEPPERRGAVSITQATEAGTLYTVAEIAALARTAHDAGMPLHMDGARWSNAVAALGCSPSEMTWRVGVDAMSLGATKAGLMGAEAVVFFDPAHARAVDVQRVRMGLSLSKQRFMGAQIAAWLRDGLWRDLAISANAAGARLSAGLAALDGIALDHPTQVNMVFARLPAALLRQLASDGARFHPSDPQDPPLDTASPEAPLGARFVCDWSADDARVDALVGAAAAAGEKTRCATPL